MGSFVKLEDSPMFRKQIYSLEQNADDIKDRCQRLHKGCKKFMSQSRNMLEFCLRHLLLASLGEAYEGDLAFADSLEAFGAGQDDPISVAIGGPIMSKFTTAFRELGTYKELLRSQVEHMLSDRLMEFMTVDLQNVKETRKRFDKATLGYDQAREKYMALKKGTRADVVSELEEDLLNSKSTFERCRFNLVNALANIDAKKKYEFLESISAVMDAHMRYFKQGYELLSQMEPFIHQVLTYAQQSKEMASSEQDKLAQRIQEYRTQEELATLRAFTSTDASTSNDGIQAISINSRKNIEALMQSTAKGEIQTIKQGYLLKRSSNLRGDWKRRFFVLDSHGNLYYYRTKWNKQLVEDNLGRHTVDLRTSTIKLDAEQTDLRFCFRIISPIKTYTLQAENAADRMDWVQKITGVIQTLLNSVLKQLSASGIDRDRHRIGDASGPDTFSLDERPYDITVNNSLNVKGHGNVSRLLRSIPGNDVCAECNAPEPEWASLNLGILICIECSGVHRNLGVHISKVRSLTLDVRVWEPTVLDLFHALGNTYCNSVWEELLLLQGERLDEPEPFSVTKPKHEDAFAAKEKYIHLKDLISVETDLLETSKGSFKAVISLQYVDKCLIVKETSEQDIPQKTSRIWEAVKTNNVQAAYRLFVVSDVDPNTRYEEANDGEVYHALESMKHKDMGVKDKKHSDPANCKKIQNLGDPDDCLQGSSLLHLACHVGDPVMLELLLQFGADINLQDFHGRTPLHHCIFKRNDGLAKYLVRRGARTSEKDGGGLTALERAMELGAITDEELFILLSGYE